MRSKNVCFMIFVCIIINISNAYQYKAHFFLFLYWASTALALDLACRIFAMML